MSKSGFYDINSPIAGDIIEDKSEIDLEEDIPLCDNCENVILKPINNLYETNNKLICPKCGQIYNPHYEIIQSQDQETTIDEISNKGQLSFKDDTPKPKKTINNRESENLESLEYVNKEFERYKQIEIIDKDTITGLNKTRRRQTN